MSDERIRGLERIFRESGSQEDGAALLNEYRRAGDVFSTLETAIKTFDAPKKVTAVEQNLARDGFECIRLIHDWNTSDLFLLQGSPRIIVSRYRKKKREYSMGSIDGLRPGVPSHIRIPSNVIASTGPDTISCLVQSQMDQDIYGNFSIVRKDSVGANQLTPLHELHGVEPFLVRNDDHFFVLGYNSRVTPSKIMMLVGLDGQVHNESESFAHGVPRDGLFHEGKVYMAYNPSNRRQRPYLVSFDPKHAMEQKRYHFKGGERPWTMTLIPNGNILLYTIAPIKSRKDKDTPNYQHFREFTPDLRLVKTTQVEFPAIGKMRYADGKMTIVRNNQIYQFDCPL